MELGQGSDERLGGGSFSMRDARLPRLHHDVAFGRAHGRIIRQPRIECWYDDRTFSGEPLSGELAVLSRSDVYQALGCLARIYDYGRCFEPVADPRIVRERIALSDSSDPSEPYELRTTTSVGTIAERFHSTASSWASTRDTWPVKSVADLRVMGWIHEHTDWRFSRETFDRIERDWDDLGAPTTYMPRANVQHLYIDIMGVEEGVFLLHDEPVDMGRYFSILEENHRRLIDVFAESPVDIINLGDNAHVARRCAAGSRQGTG